MSDEALNPCPFCGARVATFRDENRIDGWEIYCDGEVGCAGDGDSRYSTETQAIAAWNRRASDAEIERLRAALEGILESIDCLDLDETPLGYYVARAAIAKARENT